MGTAPFAVLVHEPPGGLVNIGDYVQAIAVRDALGLQTVLPLQREDLRDYDGDPVRVVGQGWYCTTDGGWPPADRIDFLPFAMHINPRARSRFETPDGLAALRRLAPIGCRDTTTLEYLRERRIPSYF